MHQNGAVVTPAQAMGDHLYFWIRRLYAPLGMLLSFSFFVLYIIPMSAATGGTESFNSFMTFVHSLPIYSLFEMLFIVVPLIMHIALAIISLYTSSFNVISYGFYGNWMYLIRILAGIYMIPFIIYHYVAMNFSRSFVLGHADFVYMQNLLGSTGMQIFYVVGVACVLLYFTMSLGAFLFEWGITSTRASRNFVSIAMWLVALVVTAWSERIVLCFF